jgi:hypothetical protein
MKTVRDACQLQDNALSIKLKEVNKFHADRAIRRFGHLPASKITLEVLDREQQYLLAHGKRTMLAGEPLSPESVKETFTLIKAAFQPGKALKPHYCRSPADLHVPQSNDGMRRCYRKNDCTRLQLTHWHTGVCPGGFRRRYGCRRVRYSRCYWPM